MSQLSRFFFAQLRRNSEAFIVTTVLSAAEIRHNSRFDAISAHIFRDWSTKVACVAPREIASMPTAPEPAQRSRKRAPSMRGAITLKSVSRKRSEVGRTCNAGGLFRFRPRNFPAITLIATEPLANCRQSESRIALHLLNHPFRFHRTFSLLQVKFGLLTRLLQNQLVANEITHAKLRQPGLPGAE